ncbi:MAG: hypothetical protein H0U84_08570 [Thermoleophilaceae bacterium]|nr:hypothetical protein [Thermoleophilaceae bacterium]
MADRATAATPIVGLGATIIGWTDRQAATITRVSESGIGEGFITEVRQRPGQKPLFRWNTGRWPEVVLVLTKLRPWLGERRGKRVDEVLGVWRELGHLYQHRAYRRAKEVALAEFETTEGSSAHSRASRAAGR